MFLVTVTIIAHLLYQTGRYFLQVAGCRLQAAGCRLQVAGCRLQVAGWNLIITGKPLALKIIDYTGQGFLHKVIGVFHRVSSVQSNTECQSYWRYTRDEFHHLLEADIELLVSFTWTFLASIVIGVSLFKFDPLSKYSYRSTRWDQWNLFKAIWMATPQMFQSIPDLAEVFTQQQKIATTNEANK